MDCLWASIFWWILVDFGRQVGVEKRAKSEQKSIKKRIENMMKKMSVLEALGWGMPRVGHGAAGFWDPLITTKNQKTTAQLLENT